MAQTQADIKRLIAKNREGLKEVLNGYKYVPEYQIASDEVEELKSKLTLAEKKQTEVIVNYINEVQSEIDIKRDDIDYLNDLLDDMKKGLDVNDYNQELIDMFKCFHSIYTTSQNKSLQWVSEDGNFAIFKTLSSQDVPVAWYLYEIKENFSSEINCDGGCIWKAEGGRWNRDKAAASAMSIKGYLNKDKFLNLLKTLGWEKKWSRDEYNLSFQSPDFIDETDKRDYNKIIYVNFATIPNTDAEAFEMYPILKNYK